MCLHSGQSRAKAKLYVLTSRDRYLETPGCILFLDQSATIREHAIATITCLLSGLWMFSQDMADHARIVRIVKGLHGLHIYANHFWLDSFLDAVSTDPGLTEGSPLYHAAQELASSLGAQPGLPPCSTSASSESMGRRESRLQHLKDHGVIYEMARKELGKRVTRTELLVTQNGGSYILDSLEFSPYHNINN